MSVIAVFIALGSGAYAAIKIPKESVGAKQLKDEAVTPPKVDPRTIELFKGERGPAGPKGAPGAPGTPGTINGVTAGGALTGTYPDPGIASAAINSAQIATGAVGADELAGGSVTTSKFGTVPAVRVTGSTTSLPSNAPTTIAWTSEAYDTANLFDPTPPNNDRLTAPVAGTYVVTGVANVNISGLAIGQSGEGFVELDENGNSGSTHFIGLENFSFEHNGSVTHTVTGMVRLSAGDRMNMVVSQVSPGTQAMAALSSFSMAWVGP